MSTRRYPKNEVDAVAAEIDPSFLAGRYVRFNRRYRKERNAEARAKAAKIIAVLDEFRATKERAMPLPEGYLPREGDVLIVHVEVKYDVDASDENVHVFPVGARYRDFALPLKNVIDLHCRKWSIDDQVTFPGMDGVGNVLAVHEDQVWVLFPDEAPQTFPANELLQAPKGTVAEIEPAVAAPPSPPLSEDKKEEIAF